MGQTNLLWLKGGATLNKPSEAKFSSYFGSKMAYCGFMDRFGFEGNIYSYLFGGANEVFPFPFLPFFDELRDECFDRDVFFSSRTRNPVALLSCQSQRKKIISIIRTRFVIRAVTAI